MESALSKACTIKILNFEGPFHLLFHLFEKDKIDIYDIPINEVTDQYMDYLSAMQELDLEITSEFLVMAATLLHIKSRMLLPEKKEKQEEEIDPREELVLKLVEYKKYKEFSQALKEREKTWSRIYYKLPEIIPSISRDEIVELSPKQLKLVAEKLIEKNVQRYNKNETGMTRILQREKVSLKAKMKEIVKALYSKATVLFSDLFSLKKNSRAEVVTGFLAILELSKNNKLKLEQKKQFSDIKMYRTKNSGKADAF